MTEPLSPYIPSTAFGRWMDKRLPFIRLLHAQFVAYPVPRNLNYLWTFGAILTIILGAQILTGVVLAMHYTPSAAEAFNSVEHIMRDVNYGWLLRYLHSNGASMFFLAVYIHMFRGIYYGSYKEPREVLWILGVIIFLLMMATAFMGYVLPWGQMSFWGATVITNLFSAIPVFGKSIVIWLWGGFAVDDATLRRFFSLHYLFPFMIAGVVVLHIWALHISGQNNPTGVEVSSRADVVPFTPHAMIKDSFGTVIFLILFMWFVFYNPNFLGHTDNYVRANPLVTPSHIVPEWYFLPFYAILRAIPNKLGGVTAMFGSIAVLFFLPWLDRSPIKSGAYRPLFRQFFWILVAVSVGLGWLGSKPPEGIYVIAARLLTFYYFLHFLVILPLLGSFETPKPLPPAVSVAMRKAAGIVVMVLLLGGASYAQDVHEHSHEQAIPPKQSWSFAGPFGHYDRAQLQRGYQIYKEVCSVCHSMNLLSYRNLAQKGGPEIPLEQVKAIASEYKVNTLDDTGQPADIPAKPQDRFIAPFANEKAAAAANGGKAPPDLSVMAKARGYERGFPMFIFDAFTGANSTLGADYIYAFLNGFRDAPAGMQPPAPGLNYNEYYPGNFTAMPPQLTDGRVQYQDGSPQTADQYARDVTAFLMWAAEPKLEERKRIGFEVMAFLLLFAGLIYYTKKKVWSDVH
jgi:ubiquinol-cytochrome c reductase cytochrome b/c1 subunit